MIRPTPGRPADVASPQLEPADIHDAALALYALDSIFAALDWIDDGYLDDRVKPAQIATARTHLILAGRIICERTTERI